MRWQVDSVDETVAGRLAARLGLSHVAAGLLIRLGYTEVAEAQRFLQPRLRSLDDPFNLTHMAEAVARVREALAQREEVLIFGDYDVDGVTSTVFFVSILRYFGLSPRHVVPRRLEEGYGLSRAALERALEGGTPDLLIAVDCGTNSVEEVAFLRERGVDVIILDHHTAKAETEEARNEASGDPPLPEDCLLVNPHVFDADRVAWVDLCTVGLVFKFVHALLKQMRQDGDALAHRLDIKEFLDLVALGTVADLVPLKEENRILAKNGLKSLQETRRKGLAALFEVSKIRLGSPLTPFDVSFRLGPRINASGRIDDASVPIEALLSDDWQLCREHARRLDAQNQERQAIEKQIADQAEEMIATRGEAFGYVLHHPDWHPGVVGIVASRVVQRHHRPALVLGQEGEQARGSGRSIKGVDLVGVLKQCEAHLGHWGGHPMAVGLSCSPENVDVLQTAFDAAIRNTVNGHLPERTLHLAQWINRTDISSKLLDELERFEPFGMGNPEPIFGLRGIRLGFPEPVGKGQRFRLDTNAGKTQLYAWQAAENPPPVNDPIDIAVKAAWNHWNGRKYARLTLEDWRPAE